MIIDRHSPSSLNKFAASPSMYVMEKILGMKQAVGALAHRGTAVEYGVSTGLADLKLDPDACVEAALERYDYLTSVDDPKKADVRVDIPPMTKMALDELRQYGTPTRTQYFCEWRPEGLKYPIIGYLDYAWDDLGVLTDLKTTQSCPKAIKPSHARQVALYATSNNLAGKVTYVTGKRRATYDVDNIQQHRNALHRIAINCERFLALSDDPEFYLGILAPDIEHYFFAPEEVRKAAFNLWGI